MDSAFVVVIGLRSGNRLVPLASVSDHKCLRMAARHAISEASARAGLLVDIDPALGAIQRAEADKLRTILSTVAS